MSELLGRPEYLHILVNPALTHALPVAALGLLAALVARSLPATRLALVLVLLSAAAIWPAVFSGREGYDRVRSMADDTGADWLAVHRHRAGDTAWVFYVVVAAAAAALLAPLRWPTAARPLAWLTLVAALAGCGVGAYIAYPAGKVRHREFRQAPPPDNEVRQARAEAGEN